VATIYHGLPLEQMPFNHEPGQYLAFVGRVAPEKGIREALELSRSTGIPLRAAAKVHLASEHAHYAELIKPAIERGQIDFLGEVGPLERDPLLAGALATVMLGAWPEPFGLVAIESMATGTPVIARRAGALTETVEHGVTGFLVDDVKEAGLAVAKVHELDRRLIRQRAIERFSVQRMVDEYETAYRRLLTTRSAIR
jgi:glycosyltransferase involved in cell wall biosynthesis